MQGPPGSIEFSLTCSPRPDSPFDLDDVHIVPAGDTPATELEGIGRALQQQVERATAGGDACERLRAWQQSAAQSE